jgi:hypothetical protein
MTIGSFMGYTSTSLLHCGVSDSHRSVYNFDQEGYHVDSPWPESISIPIGGTLDAETFDALLVAFHLDHQKRGLTYRPLGPNCYNYAVDFLNMIQFDGSTEHTVESIEASLLGQPSVDAINHLLAWRKLNEEGSLPSSCADALGLKDELNDAETRFAEERPHLKRKVDRSPVRVVLYANGFTVDGGELRRTDISDATNNSFVSKILSGKVPDELVAFASKGQLKLDLDDFRPHQATIL